MISLFNEVVPSITVVESLKHIYFLLFGHSFVVDGSLPDVHPLG